MADQSKESKPLPRRRMRQTDFVLIGDPPAFDAFDPPHNGGAQSPSAVSQG
ncbi:MULTISPECIES: hypothetical protein [unclassified Bradyrhizobium]